MKYRISLFMFLFICLCFVGFKIKDITTHIDNSIPINWVQDINNDFSFKNKWSYPEGVFKNKFGQLSCDSGICHGIDGMKDVQGKILKDSMNAFYRLVDTTHLKHSLKSKAQIYEWNQSNFIIFKRLPDNSLIGESLCNMTTHSSLNIQIEKNLVIVWVDFNSIKDIGSNKFPVKSGEIKIDKNYFEKGIIKAEFNLTFSNTINPNKELYWEGLIYSEIN